MASEKTLESRTAFGIGSSDCFRTWFLGQLKFDQGDSKSKLVLCRSNHPWGRVRLILPNEQTGALEPVDREGETDVLAVFENASGTRLGVHIENKLGSGVFTPYQPEVCAARAEHWVGKEQYGAYHHWKTVLLAPSVFIARDMATARKFISRIPHEQVAIHLHEFNSQGTA